MTFLIHARGPHRLIGSHLTRTRSAIFKHCLLFNCNVHLKLYLKWTNIYFRVLRNSTPSTFKHKHSTNFAKLKCQTSNQNKNAMIKSDNENPQFKCQQCHYQYQHYQPMSPMFKSKNITQKIGEEKVKSEFDKFPTKTTFSTL
jgi:hypothetical protein